MKHSFDVDIAVKYGVNAAIILDNILYWCVHNKANEKHFHDGLYWTYNSAKAFAELFPYMSERQVRSAIERLTDDGILAKGHYSTEAMDRTTWYAVTAKGMFMLKEGPNPEDNSKPEEGALNPFGYVDDDLGPLDTIEAYVYQNLPVVTAGNMQELETFKTDVDEDLIRWAIDEAVANSARSWAYVRKIINSWLDKGCRSMKDVREYKEKRKGKTVQNQEPAIRGKFY